MKKNKQDTIGIRQDQVETLIKYMEQNGDYLRVLVNKSDHGSHIEIRLCNLPTRDYFLINVPIID